ncbi:MAG: AAA-like domain-containing protein [Bradymonadia bacterium]
MKKRFNTAGPCNGQRHYMLPAVPRLPQLPELIETGAYFVVHAPRQTGKTTLLKHIARQVNAEGEMTAVHFSCEAGEAAGDDYVAAQRSVIYAMVTASQMTLPEAERPPSEFEEGPETDLLAAFLRAWSASCPKPLVLLFDEIDALRGQSLISVLRQLRAGYDHRPDHAPWSVALCGLRDVRDYKAASGGDASRLGTSSPFNVKVESLALGNFTAEQVATLYTQHTEASGQAFEEAAIERAFELTQGQPWLVNSLAAEVLYKMKVVDTITTKHIEQAKEQLILARATHLDSLIARLHEPAVRRILAPLLAEKDDGVPNDLTYNDDFSYVRDLGLVARDYPVRPANPIYREVIVRGLTANYEPQIVVEPARFVMGDGRFDMPAAMQAFGDFWRRHGRGLTQRGVTYPEATPHIVLMAFLHRVVNGGGFIDREYGLDRGAIDLYIRWPIDGDSRDLQHEVVEIKRWATRGNPLNEGLEQIERYLTALGLDSGWLVIFDQRQSALADIPQIRFEEHTTPNGLTAHLMWA